MSLLKPQSMPQIVDAVITWVDGADNQHRKKLEAYLKKQGIARPLEASLSRYNQCGEIEYCVKSILRFSPWIRTIYIVTDAQIPPVFKELQPSSFANKIKIIDHQELFRDHKQHLPTFNSLAIETLLWKIEGLSEQFIYFNDDVMLIRPATYDDFFNDGHVIVRGKWKLSAHSKPYKLWELIIRMGKPKKNLHRSVQQNSATLSGADMLFFALPHAPFPLKKSTFEHYFATNPSALLDNIQCPIRRDTQFSPVSLAYHLEIKQNKLKPTHNVRAIGINATHHSFSKIQRKLKMAESHQNILFVNIQNLGCATDLNQSTIFNWLKGLIESDINET